MPHPSAYVADADDPPTGPVPEPALPRLASVGEVCAVFDRTSRTLRRWIRLGYLVPVRVGGALFFDPEDIRRLIADRVRVAVLERCTDTDRPASRPPRGQAKQPL